MNTKEAATVLVGELKRLAGPMFEKLAGELRAELDERIKALPPPEPGKKGEPGRDGKDAPTSEEIQSLIAREVAAAAPPIVERLVAEMPPAEPGKKGDPGRDAPTLDELRETIVGEVGIVAPEILRGLVAALPPAQPGEKGKRGEPGKDGVATVEEIRGIIDLVVAKTLDGIEQRITEAFIAKAAELVAALPYLRYKGVWREGEGYQPGDVVTWGGNLYHCDKSSTAKPDSHFGTGQPGDWTLAVKRGDRGKDGKDFGKERRP